MAEPKNIISYDQSDYDEWNRLRWEEGWSCQEIATHVGASKPYVSKRTRPEEWEKELEKVRTRNMRLYYEDPDHRFKSNIRSRENGAGLEHGDFILLITKAIYGGSICVCCDQPLEGDLFSSDFAIDHATPKTRGGEGTLDNCNLVHYMCNAVKRNLTLAEYKAKVAWGQATVHS